MAAKKVNEIIKANALIEASYRLSAPEQRIILACIAQVRRDKPLTDEILYTVTAEQYAEMAGIDRNNAYKEIEEAAKQLFDRRVSFQAAPNGNGPPPIYQTRWVQTVGYRKAEGRVELRFSKDMVPYLSQLTSHFTRYALSDVARMSRAHAIRMYELLIQWQSVEGRKIPLDWLQERLGIPEQYPIFADFRRRVIEPSIKQINTLSPLNVTWRPIKTGRKVTALRFEFKCKSKVKQVPLHSSGGITRQEVEHSAKPGESYEQATQRIRRERLRKARAGKPTRPAKLEHKPA